MSYKIAKYRDIDVYYSDDLDGGGSSFGQCYIPVVEKMFGKVGRVFEFCGGPGFIGFSLLANGLCESLCLADVNPHAIRAVEKTIEKNNLQGKVSVYLSDGLNAIPDNEKWDLIVSNPPHFQDDYQESLRHFDRDWEIHRGFYSHISTFLNPGGSILIQENFEGSDQHSFDEMITNNELIKCASFMGSEPYRKNYIDTYYFLLSRLPSEKKYFLESSFLEASKHEDISVDNRSYTYLSSQKIYKLIFSKCSSRINCYSVGSLLISSFVRSIPVISNSTCKLRLLPGKYIFTNNETNIRIGKVIVK